jgi:hypothetical protein
MQAARHVKRIGPQGKNGPERDAAADPIARLPSTALANNLTLVTRNVKHFTPFGVPLFNPW